jgi:hypothetical protein
MDAKRELTEHGRGIPRPAKTLQMRDHVLIHFHFDLVGHFSRMPTICDRHLSSWIFVFCIGISHGLLNFGVGIDGYHLF